LLKNSLLICADVIEHLVNPMPLIHILQESLKVASYAVISTPDREVFGQAPMGPPWNPSHVREWTKDEFTSWLKQEGFIIQQVSMTRSQRIGGGQETITVVLKG